MQPHGLYPTRLLCPWDFPGDSTGVDCHLLLQGIFPNQGLNPGLPHCRQTLYHLSHQGSPPHLFNSYFQGMTFLLDGLEIYMQAKSIQSCATLCDPMDCSPPGPLFVGFSRHEYWRGLPLPPPADLPNPGIKPVSLMSPALAAGFFTTAVHGVANSRTLSLFTFICWRRKWQPTPVCLPGESQGRGSLVGCRLWGLTESDMTEVT